MIATFRISSQSDVHGCTYIKVPLNLLAYLYITWQHSIRLDIIWSGITTICNEHNHLLLGCFMLLLRNKIFLVKCWQCRVMVVFDLRNLIHNTGNNLAVGWLFSCPVVIPQIWCKCRAFLSLALCYWSIISVSHAWLRWCHMYWHINNTLGPRLNRRPFADDIFKCIFLNENEWILPRISLKFVPKVPINNIPALVQIMAWRRSSDKPLSEPMMVSLLTHICVTRPQWVNSYIGGILYPVPYIYASVEVLKCSSWLPERNFDKIITWPSLN